MGRKPNKYWKFCEHSYKALQGHIKVHLFPKSINFLQVPKTRRHAAIWEITQVFQLLPRARINIKVPLTAKVCKDGRISQSLYAETLLSASSQNTQTCGNLGNHPSFPASPKSKSQYKGTSHCEDL
jgi:hypothetical protein